MPEFEIGTPLPLWPDGAPGALGNNPEDIPSIQYYPAGGAMATGASVVICPGGGYAGLAPHEAKPVAEWLNSIGIAGIVLKYRLGPRYHHPVEHGDVSRAIRTVRANAGAWNLDPNRVGVLGFSAGGHLASSVTTHFDLGNSTASDPIERMRSRPDASILIYPVIALDGPYAHIGSRDNLLGPNPPGELIAYLSSEKQVTDTTPPVFLICTNADTGVPCENSLLFALALREHHVPFELHCYGPGEHGFGMASGDPILGTWPKHGSAWLRGLGFAR